MNRNDLTRKAAGMERYNITVKDNPFDGCPYADTVVSDDGAYMRYDDAQRALDAEREKVAKLEKIQAIDLKNNNEYREQLATLQAQLRQVEGENELLKSGQRYMALEKERDALRQLVEALPMVDAQEVSVWLSPDESGWLVSKRPAFPAGLYWAKFRTQAEADSFRALLAYRAALVVQDAPLTDEQRDIRDCCEKPHDCKWGGLGGCGYEGRNNERANAAQIEGGA